MDGAIWGLAWQGKYIYVGATNNGLYVIDASDINNLTDAVSPSSPKQFSSIPTRNWGNFKVGPVFPIGNLMVFGAPKDADGIVTLDISNPGAPVTLDTQNCSTSKTYITWFYGRWMFCEENIAIYDVTANPRDIKHIVTAYGPASEYMSFADDYLFLGALRPDPGVYKYDLTNISKPVRVSKIVNQHTTNREEDDQFSVPIGNLLFISDDEHDRGGFVAVHDTNADTKPPRVMYANPENGSSNHSTHSRIGVSFSDQIDLRTVNTSTFSLREASSGNVVNGYFGINHTVVHFAPTNPLKADTDYELYLPAGGVSDLAGNGLDKTYSYKFSTGSSTSIGGGGDGTDEGNNTETPWASEAENMTLSAGVTVASNNSGYTGTGFADYPASGGLLSGSFGSVTTGQNQLTIVYANGGGSPRYLDVTVGSQQISNVAFPATASWTQWSSIVLPVVINSATVEVRLTGVGSPGPNIDSIALQGSNTTPPTPEVEPPTCSIQSVEPSETNQQVSFSSPNQTNAQYDWVMGDKKYDNASASQSHTFQSPGRYTVSLTVSNSAGTKQCAINHIVHNRLTSRSPTHSSHLWVDESLDRVWNVNPDNNTVSAIDQNSLTKVMEVRVGRDPRSMAEAEDGSVWVVNHDDASISVINADSGQVQRTIALPYASQPIAIVFTPDQQQAFVSLQALGQVLALDGRNGNVLNTLTLGEDAYGIVPKPRGLAVSADGSRLYVTRFISNNTAGHLYEVDTGTLTLRNTIELSIDPGKGGSEPDDTFHSRGLPNYITGVTISPDGNQAWLSAKKDNIERGLFSDGRTPTFDSTVRPVVLPVDLSSGDDLVHLRIDFNDSDSPSASIFSPLGDLIFTAMQGNNQVHVYDISSGESVVVLETGAAPQGLALDQHGRLYVHNFMSRSVSIFDASDLISGNSNIVPELGVVSTVANEALPSRVLKGKQIFYDSKSRKMSQDNYISCATCHLDGGEDGRVLDFANRGEGMRNTITLRGRSGTGHGPVHWTGNFDEIQDFENDIRGHFGGAGFISQADFDQGSVSQPLGDKKAGLSAELDDLAEYVKSLTRVPNSPYRNSDGSLTAEAQLGKDIYSRLDCSNCHSGSNFTDSALNVFHDVGTTTFMSGSRLGESLQGFDTPTLKGIWNTAPYFHDGSANTLHEVIDVVGHGNAQNLSASDKNRLVSYLLQIDESIDAPSTGSDPDPETPDEEPVEQAGSTDGFLAALFLLLLMRSYTKARRGSGFDRVFNLP